MSAQPGPITRVRRLPVIDEYVEEGRSAVLVEGRALTLSEVPTLVLGLLDDSWRDLDDLAPQVEELVGAPEVGTLGEALEALMADLASHGLVETA
ncbi:hypothetical protein IEQ44_04210 [Nocardioides sp. Y6]|uniref:PqqD family protein n=1 Tax=Nocardioides malaquae TaxID=2773426 RepID=A0ABR9RRN9_9ACTN|nr:hypothetical protein [Nocardioides malaquae]MBE7323852.1 hypothetical protein [Nocardioides malaquae]